MSVSFCSSGNCSTGITGEFGTADEAKAMLTKAAAAVKADKAKALSEFAKGEGGFKDRDLYPFCGGPDGMFTAHPTLTGKSLKDLKGKTLGVTGLGSSTDFLTRYLADRQGVASKDYTLLPVGAGNTFIAAIKQDRIQAGMTTEPTVSELLKTGEAKVLVDLRTEEGSKAALGGLYPAASLYVQNAWADSHKTEATKLARAFARTMAWIHTHSAEDIAEKMPKDYYGADKALYVSALKASLPMYTTDARMPAGGPETVLKVLASYKPLVKSKNIDLSKTYTNAFLDAAK